MRSKALRRWHLCRICLTFCSQLRESVSFRDGCHCSISFSFASLRLSILMKRLRTCVPVVVSIGVMPIGIWSAHITVSFGRFWARLAEEVSVEDF